MTGTCPRCGGEMQHNCIKIDMPAGAPPAPTLWFWWCTDQVNCGHWIPSPGERASGADGPLGSEGANE